MVDGSKSSTPSAFPKIPSSSCSIFLIFKIQYFLSVNDAFSYSVTQTRTISHLKKYHSFLLVLIYTWLQKFASSCPCHSHNSNSRSWDSVGLKDWTTGLKFSTLQFQLWHGSSMILLIMVTCNRICSNFHSTSGFPLPPSLRFWASSSYLAPHTIPVQSLPTAHPFIKAKLQCF